MSKSDWTWRNLWNFLLTINFKYEYFHNSVDWSGLCLQVYIPSWLPKKSRLYTVFRLLENAFVKLPHPWHNLIINPPLRTPTQFFLHLPWNVFIKRSLHVFRGRNYALAPLENHVGGICSLNICNADLNLLTSNLSRRIVWQNRSVGWGIM